MIDDSRPSGTFDANGEIDPHQGVIIFCVGKKHSGKSVAALMFFQSYPGDRMVIDVAGDDGPWGDDVITYTGPLDELPQSWPEHLRNDDGDPMTLRYVPDAGSPTFLLDMDHMVGLVYEHSSPERPACLLVHEIGRVAPIGQTPPHVAQVLQHNRHHDLTAIFCGPRVKRVDMLVYGQADVVLVFELPSPDDRKRLADEIGCDARLMDEGVKSLRPHEYLLYDANIPKPEHPDDKDWRLVKMPALPPDVVDDVIRWAKPPVGSDGGRTRQR